MTETINALNNEFAVATGDNVGSNGYSYMDGDPSTNSNLTITSNVGDDNPYVFDVGDAYDITFDTVGGDITKLDDAKVIGSDYMPDYDAWCVTFEGADVDGNIVQVVWSPGFDLDGWRDWAVKNGYKPAFTDYDEDKETTYSVKCFTADALISTASGRVRVDTISPGDRVHTLDAGLQAVRWVGQQTIRASGSLAPILFDRGTIGNDTPLRLSPQHRVLYASPQAQLLFGDHEVLVPAKSMINGRTIRRVPEKFVTYYHLLFDAHHVIHANGAACESLFLGTRAEKPVGQQGLAENRRIFGADIPAGSHAIAARRLLSCRESSTLFGLLRDRRAMVLNPLIPQKHAA